MTTNRIDPPNSADERTLLESFLDFHRDTLAREVVERPQQHDVVRVILVRPVARGRRAGR